MEEKGMDTTLLHCRLRQLPSAYSSLCLLQRRKRRSSGARLGCTERSSLPFRYSQDIYGDLKPESRYFVGRIVSLKPSEVPRQCNYVSSHDFPQGLTDQTTRAGTWPLHHDSFLHKTLRTIHRASGIKELAHLVFPDSCVASERRKVKPHGQQRGI